MNRLLPILALIFPLSAAAEMSREEYDFILNCQGCHRSDGTGTPGSVPPLANHISRFLSTPGGREFIVRVPGVASAPLSDESIARLMNWLLPRFDPGHLPADFTPYTTGEVHELRARPLSGDLAGLRARLLDAADVE